MTGILSTEQQLNAIATLLGGTGQIGLSPSEYLHGSYITYPDNQAIACPSYTVAVVVEPEYDKCYYQINNPAAGSASYGYIPADDMRTIGPISNLSTLVIHGPGAVVHMGFWREEA